MSQTGLKRFLWLMALCLSCHAFAAEKITLIVGGIDKLIYLPARLAEQLGYFRETGLDIELLDAQSGGSAETELLSGVAQGVVGFYDHTLRLQARGKLALSVVQLAHAPGEAILVPRASGIESPSDFRGRALGITGLGSSTHYLMRYIASQAGLKPADYRLVPTGAGVSFVAAMARGEIDAGMTTEPTISSLLSGQSARVLVDLRTVEATRAALGGPYPGACLYMATTWIEQHPEEVRKIVGVFVKTLRYMAAHSGEEIAALIPEDFHGMDKALYARAIEESKPMFTTDGHMPADGPATVLRVLRAANVVTEGKSINLDNTFTTRFVEKPPR